MYRSLINKKNTIVKRFRKQNIFTCKTADDVVHSAENRTPHTNSSENLRIKM